MKILEKQTARRGVVVAATAGLLLGACADGPTGPELGGFSNSWATVTTPSDTTGAQIPDHLTEPESDTTVLAAALPLVPRRWPIDRDITRSAWIGPEGGVVEIVETHFRLEIPAGALQAVTQITVTAEAGEFELYQFGPHGIQFDVPVTMSFSTESQVTAEALVAEASGIYLDEGGSPAVLEDFPLVRHGFRVSFQTTHFSRYAMAFSGWALATN